MCRRGYKPSIQACSWISSSGAQYLIREEHCIAIEVVKFLSLNYTLWKDTVYTTSLCLSEWSTSTLPSTSSERNTVIHHVRTMVAEDIASYTSTLPSTSSERNTVIHHVRAIMATPLHYACRHGHLNIAQYLDLTTPTLYNICCQLDESIH